MKKWKNTRIIAIMLTMVMVLATLPSAAFAEQANDTKQSSAIAEGICGDNLTWTLDGNYTLTFSGTGDIRDNYFYEKHPWSDYSDKIVAIKINDGVTSIGNYVFQHFEALESVTIPESVTYIGSGAFYYCRTLKNIVIPDSVTSIGDNTFAYCIALSSITLPESLTSIGENAFLCCGPTDVSLPGGLTSIGNWAFLYCTKLKSIVIPDSVTSIGDGVFSGCNSLNSITIPDSVTYIGDEAFLDTAYYSNSANWRSGVLYIGNHLIKVKSAVAGSYSIRPGTVTIGGGAFKNCIFNTEITIPDSVKGIGDFAFKGCSSLTSITIPDSVTCIGAYAFNRCTALADITIPDSVTYIGKEAFSNTAYYNNDANWENGIFYIGNHLIKANDSLTGACSIRPGTIAIDEYAFNQCKTLTSVTIPDSVTSIGDYAFYECGALENVIIPEGVTNIENYAFCYCSALKSVTIPNSVTSIGEYAFSCCNALKSIAISDSITSIGKYAFNWCTSLESVTIPDSVTHIGYRAFEYCYKMTSILIPNSVTSIWYNAFDSCSTLVIYGFSDSYAQKYANENNIPFKAGIYIGDRFFLDVKPGAWYLSAVEYALDNGLFFGVSPKMFAPDAAMNRAMLVTVLWRMEGKPTTDGENPFIDVPSDEWYTDAVKWAASNGIVYGISEDKYDPMADITREQAAAILYRYSQEKGYDVREIADLADFPDGNETSEFAVTELAWAYGEGLITGVKKGDTDYLEPQGNATRAQVASILMRYRQNIAG